MSSNLAKNKKRVPLEFDITIKKEVDKNQAEYLKNQAECTFKPKTQSSTFKSKKEDSQTMNTSTTQSIEKSNSLDTHAFLKEQ